MNDEFFKVFERCSEKSSVIFGERSFSYAELHHSTNRIANFMSRKGIGVSSIVAINSADPCDAIFVMLACLKIGAPYVYINPLFPKSLQKQILENIQAKIVFNELPNCAAESDQFSNIELHGDLPAYIIYTSGTTGIPKGVAVPRKALFSYIGHCLNCYFTSSRDKVLVHGSLACDMPITTIFPTLCAGKTIFVLENDFNEESIGEKNFALVKLTPSHVRLMMKFRWKDFSNFTDVLILGGEALTEPVLKFCRDVMPNTRIFNEYGPTESTVGVTVSTCENNIPDIGKAIDNTNVYLLDEKLNPVTTGEVYIAGSQLALGYVENPALTAEKFVANSISNDGSRMYCTGDLAKELDGGNLFYLGRADSQVKINGNRVEPGEIEKKLLETGIIEDVFIMCDADEDGNNFLVAYYALNENANYDVVGKWREIYNALYGEKFSASVNNIGWKNSYDNTELSIDELIEWRDETVSKIPKSKNVFEIGCGTGMIATALCDNCKNYTGVDLSEQVIRQLSGFFKENGVKNVQLHTSDALNGVNLLTKYGADLVVLNSVVQYFPNCSYLVNVLQRIAETAEKRSIFIGDVRDFRLIDEFYRSVLQFNYPKMSENELKHRTYFMFQNEKELLISPSFFALLSIPNVSYVELLPKTGSYINELNLFRYDVIIHLNTKVMEENIPEYFEAGLDSFLKTAVEDKFIVRDLKIDLWKDHVESIKTNLEQKKENYISNIKNLAKSNGYDVYIALSAYSEFSVDLLFSRKEITQNDIAVLCKNRRCAKAQFNDPSKNIPNHYFKDFLKDKLPNYMIPTAFVKLNKIELCSTGKIDISALPKYYPMVRKEYYSKPRGKTEEKIARIWEKLLSLKNIGRNDDFWELGGNSLLAMQMVYELNHELKINSKLKDVFSHTILKNLAKFISRQTREGEKNMPIHFEEPQSYELSPEQKNLWFLQQTGVNKNVYHTYFATYIFGNFDVELFRQSLLRVIERHSQLRVQILDEQGIPFQQVTNAVVNYSEEDISEDCVFDAVGRESSRPFDLATGNLFRIKRFKISMDKCVICFCLHHIISDGWSIGILIDELNELYNSQRQKRSPNLPKTEYSYFDYVTWQAKFRKSEKFKEELSYWKQRLQDVPLHPIKLSSRQRSSVVDYRGGVFSYELPLDVYAKLKKFAQQEGTSVFIVLLSLFQFTLSKLTGERDVTVGVPIANRTKKQFEWIFGMFVNTLPVRTVFNANCSVREFIRDRSRQLIGDYENQDVPFDQIVNAVGGDRSIAYNPIFQIMFVFQNIREASINFQGTLSKRMHLFSQTAKCDIVLTATEEKSIVLDYEYASSLFNHREIEHVNDVFQAVLEIALNNPEMPLFDIQTMSSQGIVAQEHSITQNIRDLIWRDKSLVDKIAVVYDGKFFSYGFIEHQAELVKSYLIGKNIRVGDVVIVSLADPLEFIIAVCGVIKSGATFLPVDANLPLDRKKWVFANSKAKLYINNMEFLKEHNIVAYAPPISHLCCAYVIYTSGSTGKPKGVAISHENLLTTLFCINRQYEISDKDFILAVSNFGFDLSIFDILGTFLSKGCVVVPKVRKNPIEWMELLKKFRISVWNSVPAIFELLLDLQIELPDSLRLVLLSGDKIPSNLKNKLKNDHTKLISLGGATEAAIWSISYDLSDFSSDIVPYGYALDDQSIYVLNNLQLTPDNAVGEIFIGGNGVGLGYINQPELTAESFIANPFGNGDRLYKTGDLGMVSNGCVYILGRVDEQVKINGFRIEIQEIEKNILRCKEVKSVSVMVKNSKNNSKRIIAFVIPCSEDENIKMKIKERAAEFLPDYMIPHDFIFLNEMPLTDNGKVDSSKLEEMLDEHQKCEKTYVPPKTEIEKIMCEIWEEILSVKPIGITNNFFQLGGDSITAIRLISKLRLRGIDVQVSDIFAHQTIEKLSVSAKTLSQKATETYSFDADISSVINSLLDEDHG